MITTIADSIAIHIFNDKTILTGVGNELHYYFKQEKAAALDKRILPIKLINKVHGIVLNNDEHQMLVHGEKEFVVVAKEKHDFKELYRAKLSDWIISSKYLSSDEFVLLTAHSVILRCSFKRESSEFQLHGRSSCTDKSTLYCGSIYGENWQNLVVLGGNAFGELLIWQPNEDKAPLLHRITAHNGVIFSIAYDKHTQLLTTTSDDRSIRIWSASVNDDQWTAATLKPLASGYGHTARVFQAKIIKHADSTFILSVGEDSFICLWRPTGELLFKRRHQFGAVIWNFDYDVSSKIIYTVGSTGNCIAYALDDMLFNHASVTQTLPALCQEIESKYVAKIKFINEHLLVGVSSNNQFIYKDLSEQDNWQVVDEHAAFKCTVLTVHDNSIALCGYMQLFVYNYVGQREGRHTFVLLHKMNVLESIIRSFHYLSADRYLLSDERGNCVLLDSSAGDIKTYNVLLPQCKERWLTTALYLENAYLIVSNRQGNVMLYKFISDCYQLQDILKHPHGNLGATLLKHVSSTNSRLIVKSSGHDGTLKYIAIDRESNKMKIIQRLTVPVAWVEAIVDGVNEANELLLGFNDNHFVVWSRATDFLQQIPCGGGHRFWHYFITTHEKAQPIMQLAFIRNKQVIRHTLRLQQNMSPCLQLPAPNSWHVKACNIAKVINSPAVTHIVSAGEDNLVKISAFNSHSRFLQQVAELHMHISNIRALAVSRRNDEEYLIFSAGGRAQLCISKLQLNSNTVEELYSYMLTDKAVNHKDYKLDPETRIMTLDTQPLPQETGYLIYLGCSDGYVRCMSWHGSSLKQEHELCYGKCILQVRILANQYVLVAATDGTIHFYDLQLKQTLLQLAHHASGVNALDIHVDKASGTVDIITGGDDQLVAYTCLNLNTLAVINAWHLPFLHTAQVTATCLASDKNDVLFAYTSGVDQKVYKLQLADGAVVQHFNTSVADVKGLCMDTDSNCYLYGCGIQIFNCNS